MTARCSDTTVSARLGKASAWSYGQWTARTRGGAFVPVFRSYNDGRQGQSQRDRGLPPFRASAVGRWGVVLDVVRVLSQRGPVD